MKVSKVLVCPNCSEVVGGGEPELEVRWRCGECEDVYEDEDEAKECCT